MAKRKKRFICQECGGAMTRLSIAKRKRLYGRRRRLVCVECLWASRDSEAVLGGLVRCGSGAFCACDPGQGQSYTAIVQSYNGECQWPPLLENP